MSLLADIEAAGRATGPKCTIALILADLPPEDAEDLQTAIATERYTGNAIERALKARGYTVTSNSVLRHRRGDCRCPS